MATATETFALGGEQVTVPIHFGEVFYIDALTAPWENEFFGPWHPPGFTGNWLSLQAGATPDQTASMQAQIDAVPDGVAGAPNVIRFKGLSDGKHFTQGNKPDNARGKNGVLQFKNRHHLIIEGPAAADPATFYTAYPAVSYNTSVSLNEQSLRRHFWFESCTDITVRNLRVEGPNYTFADQLALGDPVFWRSGQDGGGTPTTRAYRDSWELEHAFAFDSCDGVLFQDCQAWNVFGDGLYLGIKAGFGTRNFRSERFLSVGTGRQGVAISSGSDIVIDNTTIGTPEIRPRRAAFDLEPVLTWVVENVEISNWEVWMGNMQLIAALGSSRVDDIKIHHGLVHGGNGGKANVGASNGVRRKNWYLGDIKIEGSFGSPQAAFRFTKVDNVTLERIICGIVTTQSRRCVEFNDCDGELILRDTAWGGGCYIDHDAASSVPQLLGTNTFNATCPTSGLRLA